MTASCLKQPCIRQSSRRGMCAAHYEQHRARQKAYGRWESRYVDAEPVRLHVKSLQAGGLGLRRIADLAGVNRKTLQWITTGRSERGQGPSHQITATNAERIMAVRMPSTAHEASADHQVVDATGTIRRLQALVAFGYSRSTLAARLGVQPSNATRLFNSGTATVLAATARKVEALFAELQLTPGPSNRARNEGRRRSWSLPLDWDEDVIDIPEAKPVKIAQERLSFPDRYAELVELGYVDDVAVARKLGITPEAVDRQLRRYGLRTVVGAA